MTPDQPSTIQRLTDSLGERFVAHLVRPARVGAMPDADGHGRAESACGNDQVQLFVRVEGDRVSDARFLASGCAHTMACASAAATCLAEQPLGEARRAAGPAGIADELGGLDSGHMHCAELAARAAREALDDALRTRQDPWRKLYRR